jgi:putative endonuclease
VERKLLKQPAVCIVTNKRNGTLYTGVTSTLPQRIALHRCGDIPGFSERYGCKQLVWFEIHEDTASAILRGKQIKAGSRRSKLALIEGGNPTWQDLYDTLF